MGKTGRPVTMKYAVANINVALTVDHRSVIAAPKCCSGRTEELLKMQMGPRSPSPGEEMLTSEKCGFQGHLLM